MNGDRENTLHHLADTLTALGFTPMALDHSYLDFDDLPIWDGITRAYIARAPQWPYLAKEREAYLAALAEAMREGGEAA